MKQRIASFFKSILGGCKRSSFTREEALPSVLENQDRSIDIKANPEIEGLNYFG